MKKINYARNIFAFIAKNAIVDRIFINSVVSSTRCFT